jgi:hypothetical protein
MRRQDSLNGLPRIHNLSVVVRLGLYRLTRPTERGQPVNHAVERNNPLPLLFGGWDSAGGQMAIELR